jgi:hypothetical protein
LGTHDLFTFASIRVHSRFSIFLQRIGAAGRIALPEMKEISRKMRDTAGGTPALPFEEAASSSLPQSPISNILSLFILCVPWRPLRLGGKLLFNESALRAASPYRVWRHEE